MQVPAQIDFKGSDPVPRLREQIVAKLTDLEHAFGRIVAARVVIQMPSAHQRSGGPYEIGIHLTLPGDRVVEVERTSPLDERFADPAFAISDAFRRARPRLQDEARRLDGRVNVHEQRPADEVVRLDRESGFGFLVSEDGSEIYFHRNSVLGKFRNLSVGSKVALSRKRGTRAPRRAPSGWWEKG